MQSTRSAGYRQAPGQKHAAWVVLLPVALTASARIPVSSHVSLMNPVLNLLNSHNLMVFYGPWCMFFHIYTCPEYYVRYNKQTLAFLIVSIDECHIYKCTHMHAHQLDMCVALILCMHFSYNCNISVSTCLMHLTTESI
jgi:hypothetical protein